MQGDAHQLVAYLLAHVASKGGVAAMDDHQLVTDILSAQLAAAMHGKDHQSSRRPGAVASGFSRMQRSGGATWAAELVLQCLQLLPRPLAAAFAEQLLLKPFIEALEQEPGTARGLAAYEALLVAAVAAEQDEQKHGSSRGGSRWSSQVASRRYAGVCSSGARQCLHALGFMLGISCWQSDCLTYQARSCSSKDTSIHEGQDAAQLPRSPAAPTSMSDDSARIMSSISVSGRAEGPAAGDGALPTVPSTSPGQLIAAESDHSEPDIADSKTASTGPAAGAVLIPAESSPVLSPTSSGRDEIAAMGDGPCSHCREVVEHIRHSYCVDSRWEGEVKELMDHNLARLGKAIKRLAGELYSKDIHFVMELVQVSVLLYQQ